MTNVWFLVDAVVKTLQVHFTQSQQSVFGWVC